MTLEVTQVHYLSDDELSLAFSDGTTGVCDLKSSLWGVVFEPLKDISLFSKVELSELMGTICWPNGADLAPEALYEMTQ